LDEHLEYTCRILRVAKIWNGVG